MKVKIIVWVDKGTTGIDQDCILEYDGFKYPQVVGHDVPIDRVKIDEIFNDCLKVYLDKYPARIDADPRFCDIHLLDNDCASWYPDGYTLLSSDKGNGDILWINPNYKGASQCR